MAKFEITPLSFGVPVPDESYIVEIEEGEDAEAYRSGWTVNGSGEPVRITVMARELETTP